MLSGTHASENALMCTPNSSITSFDHYTGIHLLKSLCYLVHRVSKTNGHSHMSTQFLREPRFPLTNRPSNYACWWRNSNYLRAALKIMAYGAYTSKNGHTHMYTQSLSLTDLVGRHAGRIVTTDEPLLRLWYLVHICI